LQDKSLQLLNENSDFIVMMTCSENKARPAVQSTPQFAYRGTEASSKFVRDLMIKAYLRRRAKRIALN
jgi:hypothetical protein